MRDSNLTRAPRESALLLFYARSLELELQRRRYWRCSFCLKRSVTMRLQILGSGDAFGSGGRLNTCFMVQRDAASFLIDCGASTMIAIRRFGVDPNQIGA